MPFSLFGVPVGPVARRLVDHPLPPTAFVHEAHLRRIPARAAIRRSIFLTRGLLGRVFLLVVCATMVTYASMMILQMPFLVAAAAAGLESTAGFWLNIAGTVTGTLGSALTAPVMIIGFVVLYYDARIRKEAFDRQIMTAALDERQAGLDASARVSPALPPVKTTGA
jgi:hypothetical protein